MSRAKTIIELRNNGMGIDDICIKLGMMDRDERHEVTRVCRKMGKPATDEEKHISIARGQLHDNEWADKYIREKTQGEWMRISDYEGMDSSIDVVCKKCGYKKTVCFATFRKKEIRVRCPICYEKEQAEKRYQRELQDAETKRLKAIRKADAKRIKACSGNQITLRFCCECGEALTFERQRCIKCQKKAENKSKDISRRKKIQSAMFDRDITVEKLFKRDKGICYICGGKCDYEDYITKDNAFIAGDFYPSIDHVKPLSKGGLHSWENVRLAHRRCNYLKSDN